MHKNELNHFISLKDNTEKVFVYSYFYKLLLVRWLNKILWSVDCLHILQFDVFF